MASLVLSVFLLLGPFPATEGSATGLSYPGFALVELFTSQGCSSCPPADQVLRQIAKEAEEQVLPVYALSFHVDYWNRLGWKDPYSQSAFSLRQRNYAKQLPDRVYTPQMVVNGQWGFVGSRATEAKNRVEQALQLPARAAIGLEARKEGSRVRLDYVLEGNWSGQDLFFALVEDQVGSDVPRGENAGRTLDHAKVVRELQKIRPQSAKGTFSMATDVLEHPEAGELIAFLQDPTEGKVSGAARVKFIQLP